MTATRQYSREEAAHEAHEMASLVGTESTAHTDYETAYATVTKEISPPLRAIAEKALQMPEFMNIWQSTVGDKSIMATKAIRNALKKKFPEINDLPKRNASEDQHGAANDFVTAKYIIKIFRDRRL